MPMREELLRGRLDSVDWTGMEWWTGLEWNGGLDWNGGMEWWNGMVEWYLGNFN